MLAPGQPAPALTLRPQVSGSVATGMLFLKVTSTGMTRPRVEPLTTHAGGRHLSMENVVIIIIIIIRRRRRRRRRRRIALKGAIRDFLQSPHCARNYLQHVQSSGPGAIVCKPSVYHVHHAVCHLVRRDSSAIKFDRV